MDEIFELVARLAGEGTLRVFNARGEFACNSSSSHSIILLPPGHALRSNPSEYGFGTDDFTLTSSTDKLRYLAALLGSDPAAQDLAASMRERSGADRGDRVDHQSLFAMPRDRFNMVDADFVEDLATLFSNPRVVILGGSDEVEEHPALATPGAVAIPLKQGSWRLRRDETPEQSWWTLFSAQDGTRLRLGSDPSTFENPPTKGSAPELVDVKVTDRCAFERDCGFCFAGDTEYLTLHGTRTFAETVGTTQKVLVRPLDAPAWATATGFGVWMDASIRSFGVQPLLRVTLTQRGETRVVHSTAEHRWITGARLIRATSELEAGTVLAGLFPQVQLAGLEPGGTLPASWVVASVEPTDRVEEVFCAVVPDHENFTLAGNINVMNCYMGSTRNGDEGDFDQVVNLVTALGEAGVFEIAFGGGEPTLWPHMAGVMEVCHSVGVVPNFTTKNFKFFRDNPELLALAGSVALSVNDRRSFEQLKKATAGLDWSERHKLSIQSVVGIVPEDLLRDLFEWASESGLRLTLLGFKYTGRGAAFTPAPTDWVAIAKDFPYLRLAIDTVLADADRARLEAEGVPDWCYTTSEGAFSCYVDAVTSRIGASSYAGDESLTAIDLDQAAPALHADILTAFKGY